MKSSIQKWMLRTAFCTITIAGAATVQAQTDAPITDIEPGIAQSQVHLQQLSSDPTKFRLQFTSPNPGKVMLMITDMEGNMLLNTKMQQSSFAQTFDLSMLKDGVYTFTLQKGKDVVKKIVQLNTDYVTIKKASIK